MQRRGRRSDCVRTSLCACRLLEGKCGCDEREVQLLCPIWTCYGLPCPVCPPLTPLRCLMRENIGVREHEKEHRCRHAKPKRSEFKVE